jgi:hypothetical protein
VFAVAALLLEAWSGEAPFRRPTAEASFEAMKSPPPAASAANPRLLPLDTEMSRALSMNPEERQQDIDELGRALRGFLQGIDTTDIARGLGARVRTLRHEFASRLGAPSTLDNPDDDGATAEPRTKTFAARQEVEHWAEPSVPPAHTPSDAPSTRRLPSSDAPPASHRALGPVPKAPRVPAEAAATPANRAQRSLSEHPGAGRAWLFLGLLAASLVGVAVVALPGPAPAPLAPSSTVSTGTPRPTVAALSGTASSAPASFATSTASGPTATAPASALDAGRPPPEPPVSPRPSVSAAPQQGRGSVSIAGEPGTSLSVDGIPRGPVPQRLSLDPGPHEFRFVYNPTGESKAERLTLRAGDRVLLRSSFTGATPTVFVSRN